jgi:hypothetical protein
LAIWKQRSTAVFFKGIFCLNGSFFGDGHRSFSKECVKMYQMTPISPLNGLTFFFPKVICDSPRDSSHQLRFFLLSLPFGTWLFGKWTLTHMAVHGIAIIRGSVGPHLLRFWLLIRNDENSEF